MLSRFGSRWIPRNIRLCRVSDQVIGRPVISWCTPEGYLLSDVYFRSLSSPGLRKLISKCSQEFESITFSHKRTDTVILINVNSLRSFSTKTGKKQMLNYYAYNKGVQCFRCVMKHRVSVSTSTRTCRLFSSPEQITKQWKAKTIKK